MANVDDIVIGPLGPVEVDGVIFYHDDGTKLPHVLSVFKGRTSAFVGLLEPHGQTPFQAAARRYLSRVFPVLPGEVEELDALLAEVEFEDNVQQVREFWWRGLPVTPNGGNISVDWDAVIYGEDKGRT